MRIDTRLPSPRSLDERGVAEDEGVDRPDQVMKPRTLRLRARQRPITRSVALLVAGTLFLSLHGPGSA